MTGPTQQTGPSVPTVVELVLDQALRTPDAVAVESAGTRLTYAQLVAEAAGVADHLCRSRVAASEPVAVALPRTADLVAVLLGVQLAGAAYLPLDPDHPVQRQNRILADCAARVLVTADAAGCRGLDVAERMHLTDVVPRPEAPLSPPDPHSTAYLVYTSGSTGRPKGVAVPHTAFANFVRSMRDQLALPDDVVLPAVTTVSFDIAGLELFLPLTTGGRVVVASEAETTDPRRLAGLLAATGAAVLQATPVTWRLLLDAGWTPPPGFTVLCGGERLPADLAERLLGDGVVLWDLYGPTETTVWSSVTRYERGRPPRFEPVRATTLHVLDDDLRPLPVDAVGELYIGGAGLALGYLGRAGLTAGRFVADPFAAGPPGSRLYRTGDLARRHPDGRIEILGRSDDQIKVRGFRIEPGEVEHLLTGHPGIAEAVVTALPEPDGSTALAGYVRPSDPDDPPSAVELRRHLARVAPAYLVPARFAVVDAFPRTLNGKLDRAALRALGPALDEAPAPDAADTGAVVAAGGEGGPLAQRIAAVLAEVLQRPSVGLHEDFFTLGGDSLRAVQIILRLNDELETEIPINALFETRTVYGLAALLAAGDTAETALRSLADGDEARLSAAQWRLWLHQRSTPDSTADNVPIVVRLPGPPNLAALDAAVAGLFDRHPVLRARYVETNGLPAAVPGAPAVLPPAEDGDPRSVLAEELARPFDLAREAPVRLRLVRLRDRPDESAVLLMVLHRIAADERSCELIAAQIRAAYRGRSVPAPALGYGDYAAWQRELSTGPAATRQRDHWRSALSRGVRPELPLDRPRPEVWDERSGTVAFSVPSAVVAAVTGIAEERAVGPGAAASTGLLAAFAAALGRWTGAAEAIVGVAVAGRDRPELADVVGMIEETVPVRVAVGDRPGPAELSRLVDHVRAGLLGAAEHVLLPFEDVVAAVAGSDMAAPSPGRHPLFDVFFAFHPPPVDAPDFVLPETAATRYDVSCRLVERLDGGVDGRLGYATVLFDEPTVQRLADHYVALLGEAARDAVVAR